MKTVFKLKVLTPMFMGGANPRGEPELRAASIRGAMRFWFRAIAGAVTSDPREVYRLESEVFGNTEHKSKVVVRVKTKFSENDFRKFRLLPHKAFKAWAIPPDKEFDIELKVEGSRKSREYLKLAFYSFWLSTALGGWGRRSRRGAGTVMVKEFSSDFDEEEFKKFFSKPLKEQLDVVKVTFKSFLPKFKSHEHLWPYLIKVNEWNRIFPNSWNENSPAFGMFKKLSKFIRENGECLGQIRPRRYASPIVVRVIEKNRGYTLRFAVLHPNNYDCENVINEFFEKLGNVKEVWSA